MQKEILRFGYDESSFNFHQQLVWASVHFFCCNSLAAFSLQKFQLKIHKWIMWLSTVREKMQLLAKYQELSSIFHCNVTMVSLWFVMDDVHSLDCMRIKFRIYEFIFFAWFSMHFFLRIAFTVFVNRNGSLAWLCNTAYCSICIWHQFKRQLLLSQFFAFEYGIMSNGYSYDIFSSAFINYLHVEFYGSANQICSGSLNGTFSVQLNFKRNCTERDCDKKAYH